MKTSASIKFELHIDNIKRLRKNLYIQGTYEVTKWTLNFVTISTQDNGVHFSFFHLVTHHHNSLHSWCTKLESSISAREPIRILIRCHSPFAKPNGDPTQPSGRCLLRPGEIREFNHAVVINKRSVNRECHILCKT